MTERVRPDLRVAVRNGIDAGLNGTNGHHGGGDEERTLFDAPLFPLTDLGNAERLVHRYGTDLRYVAPWKRWLYWDGTRWKMDATSEIERRAKATVRSIRDEAEQITDAERRQEVWKHAIKSEAGTRLRECIKCAQAEATVSAEPDLFEQDPMLATCPNGTIDLRTGQLLPHRREDYITKSLTAPFDPGARAQRWEDFLWRIMAGNDRLIAFLQRALGYSLTGVTIEQVIFFCYGTGRNGKSLFVNTAQRVMGDYSRSTRPETLMAKPGNDIPNEIAALVGARFVPTIEVEDGARMAESLVKQLTGGDRVSARFLYAETFEFEPAMKLWMVGNHKPIIRGGDIAIWERILTVPFEVTIPMEERDKRLSEKLLAEAPGILAWMVRGCLEWQAKGLDPPPEVTAATEGYREEMDTLGQFIAERCVVEEWATVAAAALYGEYTDWCQDTGERPWSANRFSRALAERGFDRDRAQDRSRARTWRGIGLREGV